jgi:hypothetical protein
LQELLAFSANGTDVVSMYLDTDCAQQPAEITKLQVKAMLRELNGSNEDDAPAPRREAPPPVSRQSSKPADDDDDLAAYSALLED